MFWGNDLRVCSFLSLGFCVYVSSKPSAAETLIGCLVWRSSTCKRYQVSLPFCCDTNSHGGGGGRYSSRFNNWKTDEISGPVNYSRSKRNPIIRKCRRERRIPSADPVHGGQRRRWRRLRVMYASTAVASGFDSHVFFVILCFLSITRPGYR